MNKIHLCISGECLLTKLETQQLFLHKSSVVTYMKAKRRWRQWQCEFGMPANDCETPQPPPLKEKLAGVKRGTQKDMYAEMFYHASAAAHWLYLP